MNKVWKIVLYIFASLVLLFLIAIFSASLVESPAYVWRLFRYGESDINDYRIFPEREIENGTLFSNIPAESGNVPLEISFPYNGKMHRERLDELLARTGTHAFLILKDDVLVYEKYINSSRDSINTSFSAAKSFISALIGAAISEGYISSVDEKVIKFIPEIIGRGLDKLTIRDLLMMNSGVQYRERSELPFYYLLLADDARTYYSTDMRKLALSVKPDQTNIGDAFHYNNFYPLLEGLILELATGMHVAEFLQEHIWQPMGAEFPASWSLDSQSSGFEKMESGINARAIDFARFGLIFLHNGLWNGVQILPEAWVMESTQSLDMDERDWGAMSFFPAIGGYYKYHWWGFNNGDGTYDYYAHGKYDQIIYIAPRANIVIVRLGEAPDKSVIWPIFLSHLVDQLN